MEVSVRSSEVIRSKVMMDGREDSDLWNYGKGLMESGRKNVKRLH
jgi:hypothetical protein